MAALLPFSSSTHGASTDGSASFLPATPTATQLRAAALRPEVSRDAAGLSELEFVMCMAIELGLADSDHSNFSRAWDAERKRYNVAWSSFDTESTGAAASRYYVARPSDALGVMQGLLADERWPDIKESFMATRALYCCEDV